MNVTSKKRSFLLILIAVLVCTVGYAVPCPQVELTLYTGVRDTTNRPLVTEVGLFTCYDALAEYEFRFTYDPLVLELDTGMGLNGVTPSNKGYVSAVTSPAAGELIVNGKDPAASGTFATGAFINIHWRTKAAGNGNIVVAVNKAFAPDGSAYTGILIHQGGNVTTIMPQGDVNASSTVDIVDALLIAQTYVGLTVSPYYKLVADVNADKTVDILDALITAKYYVGLVDSLPVQPVNPNPIPADQAYKLSVTFRYADDNYRLGRIKIDIPYYYLSDDTILTIRKGDAVELESVENAVYSQSENRLVYFDHWEGDIGSVSATNDSMSVLLDRDKSVTACFGIKVLE